MDLATSSDSASQPGTTRELGAPGPAGRYAMQVLRDCLDRSAYGVLHAIAAEGQPLVADRRRALRLAGPEPEWSLYRLLGLGSTVGVAELGPSGVELASALASAGLASAHDGLIETAGFIVVPALRGYLLTGLPPTHGGRPGASAYLGLDSLRLAAMLPAATGKRVLDLGAGCGVQGLLACRGAAEAVLTDIDAPALEVAALNALLNGVEHPVRYLEGNLFEPVAGERFDLVVSLPPYLPDVAGSGVTSVAAGGADGLAVLVPLLAAAPPALADGGELYVIAQLLCDDDGPLLAEVLPPECDELAVELFCSERHPLRPWIAEVAGRLALHGATLPVSELVAAYAASLRAVGASGICTTLVRARAGAGSEKRTVGPSGAVLPSSVLRHAAALASTPVHMEAVGPQGGATTNLDELGMALLRGLDGERDVATAAALAWGEHPEADARDLAEMAAWRGEELARLGLVEAEPGQDDAAFAPFGAVELLALEEQQLGEDPAYTCPTGDGAVLAAEREGWRCPACDARQTWAFALDALPGGG